MNIKKYSLIFTWIFLSILQISYAQEIQDQKKQSQKNKSLKWSLNEEGTHWIGMHAYVQFSARVNENNPGSLVNGELENTTTDLSIRRYRIGIKSQVSEHLFIYTQLGTNNLNYLSSRGPSIKLLDAYAEYSFSDKLSIGGGKSLWNGLSRFSAPSTSKLMVTDVPFVTLPTVNTVDDLLRNLSVYAKGKLNKIDYRFLVSKPLPIQSVKDPKEDIAEFTNKPSDMQYAGYLKYEFFEPESNKYSVHGGTYLGKKKVLSLGAGFKYQSDALCSLEQGEEVFHDMNLLAADLYLDFPINKEKGTALTSYLGFFEYDFGPNYTRLLGANNPTNGLDPELGTFSSRGNSYPVIGTGTSVLYQIGYLFPKMGKNEEQGQLQPYGRMQYSDYDHLDDAMTAFDLGINWFLDGHLSKFSFNAQNRPIYDDLGNGLEIQDRKWMFVLQYQFRL